MLALRFFLGTLEVITRFVIQCKAFVAIFPMVFRVLQTTCTRREYFEEIHDVFEALFVDFVTCSWICLSTCGNTYGIVQRL